MYLIEDQITDQKLSNYSKDPELWEWNEQSHGNLYSNVQIFETKEAAQMAIRHLESVFRSYGETKINFVIKKVLLVRAYKVVESGA